MSNDIDNDGNNVSSTKLVDASIPIANNDTLGIIEYFRNSTGNSPVRMKISRVQPTMWQGKPIAGLLDIFDELMDEEQIKQLYGGGKYQIIVTRQHVNGKYVHAGSRTIQIAGNPKLGLDSDGDGNGNGKLTPLIAVEEKSSLSEKALATMERTLEAERLARERSDAEAREAAREARTTGGFDPGLLAFLTKSMESQVEAANRRAEAIEREIIAIRTHKPEASVQDKIFEKVLTDDNARINAIRETHLVELRTLRENHAAEMRALKDANREDLKRLEDRHDRAMDAAEKTHGREIDTLKMSHEAIVSSTKIAYEGRLAAVESENKRLMKELEEKKAEIKELQTKKDKPLTEQIVEFAQVKEALGAFGSEAEPPTTFDKVMGALGPALENLSGRLGQPAMPVAPAPMPSPAAQKVLKRRTVMIPTVQAAQGAGVQTTPQAPPKKVPKIEITPDEVRLAIQFIESAVMNETTPEQFVSSFQSMIPGGVIQAIRLAGGVDKFMEGRVQLGAGSPLTTINGRNFIRKVEKLLIGDTPNS